MTDATPCRLDRIAQTLACVSWSLVGAIALIVSGSVLVRKADYENSSLDELVTYNAGACPLWSCGARRLCCRREFSPQLLPTDVARHPTSRRRLDAETRRGLRGHVVVPQNRRADRRADRRPPGARVATRSTSRDFARLLSCLERAPPPPPAPRPGAAPDTAAA